MEELIRKNRKSRERSEERQDQPKVLDNGTVSSWHDGKHHVVRWLPNNLYSIYYSCSEQCATTIRYWTFNALYHSCSTAFSVLEESGQVYFSCTRIPGSLLFSFSTRGTARSCLLACLRRYSRERASQSLGENSIHYSSASLPVARGQRERSAKIKLKIKKTCFEN